jgi:hypothetical protein
VANIGIAVNVEVTIHAQLQLPLVAYGSYSANVNASQTAAQLEWIGALTWAPGEPTPADAWLTFVSNVSGYGNYAIYSNPNVQPCVNGFTDGSSVSKLLDLCTKAYSQIYNDAPYAWLGSNKLFLGAGSLVWQKSIVKTLLVDPDYSGQSATAIFNTVQFVSG